MAYAETSFPLPVARVDQNGINVGFNAAVLQRTIVGPHVWQTSDVAHRLAGQEVCGLAVEIFNTEGQAVVQQIGLQTDIETVVGFPLDGWLPS